MRNYVIANRNTTQLGSAYPVTKDGVAEGICPLGSCFHRYLISSRPTASSIKRLNDMLLLGFEGSKGIKQIKVDVNCQKYFLLLSEFVRYYRT